MFKYSVNKIRVCSSVRGWDRGPKTNNTRDTMVLARLRTASFQGWVRTETTTRRSPAAGLGCGFSVRFSLFFSSSSSRLSLGLSSSSFLSFYPSSGTMVWRLRPWASLHGPREAIGPLKWRRGDYLS